MPATDILADEGSLCLEIAGDGFLSAELVQAVNEFCDRVEDAPEGPVALVRLGPGTEPPSEQARPDEINIHLVNRWERALRRIERLGAVTVAITDGYCPTPALEVLLTTDYRVAKNDTRIALPTRSGQFWPGMVMHRLTSQLGVARTRQLLLRSTGLSAEHAFDLGLLDELDDDVTAAVSRAVSLAGAVPGAEFAIRRRLLLEAPTTSFEDALGVHLAACDRTIRHEARESSAGTSSTTDS